MDRPPAIPEHSTPHIALIGGGTGSFTLLQELKSFTPNISALVNMSDDGGSSGRLRDELGVLPPGDTRQCLVALSNMPEVRDLFMHRFTSTSLDDAPEKDQGLDKQSVGNLIISGLTQMFGDDYNHAVSVASRMLSITGEVVPITTTKHTLIMHDDGQIIKGEYKIAHRAITGPDVRIELRPPAEANPDAIRAIDKADIVVIAPGNLYGSLLPALSVDGVSGALEETRAKKVMIANLMTSPGQTDGWHVAQYLEELESYIGDGQIDAVLYNTRIPAQSMLERYQAEGEFMVGIDSEGFRDVKAEQIGADLLSDILYVQPESDAIPRTLVRHNAHEVGRQLMRIYYS